MTTGEPLEPGEVRLRARHQVLVGRLAEHDPVLDDEARVVEPGRVLAATDRAGPDVARENTGEERLGVGTADPVLEQRRGVEEAGTVPDREVLELLGQLVFLGNEVAGPVLPEAGLVGGAGPLVEGCGPDHRDRRSRIGVPAEAVVPRDEPGVPRGGSVARRCWDLR